MRIVLLALTLFTVSPKPLSVRDVYLRAAESSVRVRHTGKDKGKGSGTIIWADDRSALVLTCAHVVGEDQNLLVDTDTDGEPMRTYPATLEKVDPVRDLALVRALKPLGRRPAKFAYDEPELYEQLYTVASPLGIMRQSGFGVLNTKDAGIHGSSGSAWTITGVTIHGMSGGAWFNAAAEIACVVSAVAAHDGDEYPQLGFCVSLRDVLEFLDGYAL